MAANAQSESETKSAAAPKVRSRVWTTIAAGFIVLHLAVGLHTAFNKSVTHDEIWHLPVGILNLSTGRFDYDNLNPPLTRMWSALPAWLAGVEVKEAVDATDIALKFVNGHKDYRTWYLWGRGMSLLLSAATAVVLCCWARHWFGAPAGTLAVALYCTCPNVIAHCSLVTPEAGVTLGFVATLYLLTRWLDRPTWRRAMLYGVVLGVAQGMKFTAVVLYPLNLILTLIWPRVVGEVSPSRWRTCLQFVAACAVSVVIWNAAYAFRNTGDRLEDFAFESQTLNGLMEQFPFLEDVPVPLPRDYVAGLDQQKHIMEQPHPVFLDGELRQSGFPSYYLRVLEYKLPHLLQGAFVLGLIIMLLRRKDCPWRKQSEFWLPIALLLAIASFSNMQLGVRYVLPILPLMMLVAANAGRLFEKRTRLQSAWVGLLLTVTLFSLRHHPHHLAYFNEHAGGPIGGRHHLIDSNLDWGQDLHLVRDYMDEINIDEINLVYFGTLPPEALGIEYQIPEGAIGADGRLKPGFAYPPGWYAVSVNYVMGRPHTLRLPDGTGRATWPNDFVDFARMTPRATLGGSIDIYHVE